MLLTKRPVTQRIGDGDASDHLLADRPRMKVSFIGYHGCEASVGESVRKTKAFQSLTGDREWLGDGMYFFEGDPGPAHWWVKSVTVSVVLTQIG